MRPHDQANTSVFIIGICGALMSSIAKLACQLGMQVSGYDQSYGPPSISILEKLPIKLLSQEPRDLSHVDIIIVGNTCSRHHPIANTALSSGSKLMSAPQFLREYVLYNKHVICVAGTHGKTTTTGLLAWILHQQGKDPSYLLGSTIQNFDCPCQLTSSPYFVIEADEYDSAFFDKRSKFLHYFPKSLILNPIEFDHADIFDSIKEIKTSFQRLLMTLPDDGYIISHDHAHNLDVLKNSCAFFDLFGPSSHSHKTAKRWAHRPLSLDYRHFEVYHDQQHVGTIKWNLMGNYNADNAIAAIALASHLGISPHDACLDASRFKGVKRRYELIGYLNKTPVYDDYAHHPTSISLVLQAAKRLSKTGRIIPIIDPQNHSMKSGQHLDALISICQNHEDDVLIAESMHGAGLIKSRSPNVLIYKNHDHLVKLLSNIDLNNNDQIIMMSSRPITAIFNIVDKQHEAVM